MLTESLLTEWRSSDRNSVSQIQMLETRVRREPIVNLYCTQANPQHDALNLCDRPSRSGGRRPSSR
jgi:hypothetical protein